MSGAGRQPARPEAVRSASAPRAAGLASWLRGGRGWLVAAGALAVVTLVVTFALPAGVTFGASDTDLIGQFVPWRAFAAERLRAGDFPFWNPYVFSGQPFLGGFQSALLYPPNLVFLVLPLDRALTFSIVVHLAILGAGMAWWARRRDVHPVVAIVMGFAAVLSGVVFPHVYAGHLSNLGTMAWVPWAFAGFEAWWRERRAGGLLLASAAIALQILAGQVQYVFFAAIAAGLYAVVVTAFEPGARRRALPGLAGAGLAAAALAAAQLLPGLEAGTEGVRQGRLDYGFASLFALPPENLLTAIAPGFFGDTHTGPHPYWGRCYGWEMSVHLGVFAAWCAAVALRDRVHGPRARADLLVGVLLLVLALGRHLPLYDVLYAHGPGFGQLRGVSKFTFPALLCGLMAAAGGLDGFVRGRWPARRIALAMLAGGAVLGGAAVVLWAQPGLVRRIFEWILTDPHADLAVARPTFPGGAEAQAAVSLGRAAIFCLLAAAITWAAVRWPRWRWAGVAIMAIEAAVFASAHLETTAIAAAMPKELREFVAARPGDYRVLNLARPNGGFLLGAPDLWGNDPGVLQRYAEFMTFTQGRDPAAATQNLTFTRIPPLYAMLRCRYAFVPSATGVNVVDVPNPLPRALLISEYQVAAGREAVLAALTDASFDPRRKVVLEGEPSPRPRAGTDRGSVRVTTPDVDALMVEAEVAAPMLLLITEPYSRGWRATALPGSAQDRYEIVRANYILQALPLGAGRHHLKLEYRPQTFTAGAAISVSAWLGWLGAIVALRRRPAKFTQS